MKTAVAPNTVPSTARSRSTRAPRFRWVLSAKQAARARFCFAGEFGYELISWVPYLRFLHHRLGIPLRTASRPGSSVFYAFSSDHVELDPNAIGACWGDLTSYAAVARRFRGQTLVHPGMQKNCVSQAHIEVEGHTWRTKDIHRPIELTHYERLDFSDIAPWSPIADRPIVVINNKYFVQWADRYDRPVNYLDPEALRELRGLLTAKGYGVVYNHFVEQTATDEHLELADTGIFGGDAATFDMRSRYHAGMSPGERNRLQLSLYRAAELVIGPQGGNLYLPVACRRPFMMLMRSGDYIDYLELARVYEVEMEAFYEPRHMLNWLHSRMSRMSGGSTPRRSTPGERESTAVTLFPV